jgi:hypothetical protein
VDAVPFVDINNARPPEAAESENLLPDFTGDRTNDSPSRTTGPGVAVAAVAEAAAVGVVAVRGVTAGPVTPAVATVTVFGTGALLTETARAAPATSTSRPNQDSIGATERGSCAGLTGGTVGSAAAAL